MKLNLIFNERYYSQPNQLAEIIDFKNDKIQLSGNANEYVMEDMSEKDTNGNVTNVVVGIRVRSQDPKLDMDLIAKVMGGGVKFDEFNKDLIQTDPEKRKVFTFK